VQIGLPIDAVHREGAVATKAAHVDGERVAELGFVEGVGLARLCGEDLVGRLVKRKGRNLRPGESSAWRRDFFEAHGLHRLRGTIRYPEAA
jgi:hypothetical protein